MKTLIAVGNGNEMLEATKDGSRIIRHTWDERSERYVKVSEDWGSAHGVKLLKGSVVIVPPAKQMDEQALDEAFGERPLDENDYCGAGWS